jgi:hypothetical protein
VIAPSPPCEALVFAMTPLRWCLVALAFLGAVAAGLLAVRPATVAPPDPFTPTPALPPAQPGAPTPIAAVTAAPPTSAPGLPPPRLPGAAAPAPRVGSEGYGPHIDQAAAGSDAAAAWEAVRWLRQCASNEQRRGSFEAARNQGTAPEMMTQLMVEADAEARRCQTVTAAHRALLPELAARAMRDPAMRRTCSARCCPIPTGA